MDLFREGQGLAFKQAHGYWKTNKRAWNSHGYDLQDVSNLALFGLWKASKFYKQEKGRFSSYATRVIKNTLNDELEYAKRKRRYGQPISLSWIVEKHSKLAVPYPPHEGGFDAQLEKLLPEKKKPYFAQRREWEELSEVVNSLQGISQKSKNLFLDVHGLRDGMPKERKEVAALHGTTVEAVKGASKTILRRLRRHPLFT